MIVSVKETVDLLLIGGSSKACEIALEEKKAGQKVLIATPYTYFGDDLCAPFRLEKIPGSLKKAGVPDQPAPLTVKRILDRIIIEEEIPFLFRAYLLGLVKDTAVFADMSGVYAVRARAIVDATHLHTAAHLSKMPFTAFVPGEKQALVRSLVPCTKEESRYSIEDRFYRFDERSVSVPMQEFTPDAYFHAVIEARLKTWKKEDAFVADRVEFSLLPEAAGPDPEKIVFTPDSYSGIVRGKEALSTGNTVDFEVPFRRESDLLVTGGGTAGASAALPAAEAHLRTLVIEQLSRPGGIGTQGRIPNYWYGLKIAHTKVLDVKLEEISGFRSPGAWFIEAKEHLYERENQRSGVDFWFDSFCASPVIENGIIKSLLAATPFGGYAVTAKEFIDCTGNAYLARLCGAPTEYSSEKEPACQGAGMSHVIPGKDYTNTDYMFTVDDSPSDAARAFITGRDRCREHFDLAQIPGTRERRRIIGEIVLRASDFYADQDYPDTIMIASSNFDTHGFTVDPLLLCHPTDEKPYVARIPFRALLSPGIANLMTTGLGISAQRDAMPLIRMIADVQNQGYAAGLLAAEALLENVPLRSMDFPKVQRLLKERGFLDPVLVLPHADLNQDAAIFASPDLPALEKDYQAAPSFEKALRLALLGSSCGKALLEETVFSTPWDDGWDYRGMGQFGKSASRQDAAILALIPLEKDAAFLFPKLGKMEKSTQFSHYRSVARFLMEHPAPEAAALLERLLNQFECHAATEWKDLLDSPFTGLTNVEERNLQLRELYLAGALHACDPENPLALEFLEKYRKGLHKLYAIYAEKWIRIPENEEKK